jgi:hypothetical protein
MNPAVPVAKRPSAVTLTGALLVVAAVALIIRALLPLPYLSDAADAARAAYANSTDPNLTPDRFATILKLSIIGTAVVSILIAVGILVLARLDLRGNNVARILTWVLGGIGVLCCGLGSLVGAASGGLTMSNNKTSGVDAKEATRHIMDAYPSWYQPLNVVLTVIMVLALAAAVILLLTPAANAYFRRGAATPQIVEPPYPTLPT